MEGDLLVGNTCGNDSFAQGELGGSYANVKPIRLELNFSGSPMILSIASMKVKKLDRFK
ncbi:hypothetical protein ACFTQ7_14990 [Lysinibacillus sp. NPDC056959]|uniref:hypothetical protein n=1 Tax=Lysinibacillus sp. NPDC056959 TaxID=3345981 RepID=UPI00363C9CBB